MYACMRCFDAAGREQVRIREQLSKVRKGTCANACMYEGCARNTRYMQREGYEMCRMGIVPIRQGQRDAYVSAGMYKNAWVFSR
jgi:hypothetical protein